MPRKRAIESGSLSVRDKTAIRKLLADPTWALIKRAIEAYKPSPFVAAFARVQDNIVMRQLCRISGWEECIGAIETCAEPDEQSTVELEDSYEAPPIDRGNETHRRKTK